MDYGRVYGWNSPYQMVDGSTLTTAYVRTPFSVLPSAGIWENRPETDEELLDLNWEEVE